MMLSNTQHVKNLKISKGDRILDVGGSMKQHTDIQIDTLVDIIRPEESKYNRSKLHAKHFVKCDFVKEKLPFKDKEFDVCLCTHVLEDLYDPFPLINEMSRVAKRGYIATPSMGKDIEFTKINFSDWKTGARRLPGVSHHKWLFYMKDGKMVVLPKNYPLLYSSDFHVSKWLGEEEFRYFWKGKIEYVEKTDIDFKKLINEYRIWFRNNKKYIKKSPVLLYLDNPFNIVKEYLKLLIKK